MTKLRLKLIIICALVIAGPQMPAHAAPTWSEDPSDVWSDYLIPPDPLFVTRLKEYSLDSEYFNLNSYEYHQSPGIIVSDIGFLASYRESPPLTRVTTYSDSKAVSFHSASPAEISKIQELAVDAVAQGYAGRIQESVRKIVLSVENSLEKDRMKFATVTDRATGRILGVLRTYEGHFEGRKLILPALEIMRQMRTLTAEDEETIYQQLRDGGEANPEGHSVIEVGQFYIVSDLEPKAHLEVKRRLLAWMLSAVLHDEKNPKIVLAHVSTDVHAKMYRKDYGLESAILTKTFQQNGEDIAEKIIVAPQDVVFPKTKQTINRCELTMRRIQG